jgi:hypothetical protein
VCKYCVDLVIMIHVAVNRRNKHYSENSDNDVKKEALLYFKSNKAEKRKTSHLSIRF